MGGLIALELRPIQSNLRFFFTDRKPRALERGCIVSKKGAICPIFEGDMPPSKMKLLMNKLMTLKIADSPIRHSFLVSFQEVCNRYDQLVDVRLADSFNRIPVTKYFTRIFYQ
jgi:hypothetical protein